MKKVYYVTRNISNNRSMPMCNGFLANGLFLQREYKHRESEKSNDNVSDEFIRLIEPGAIGAKGKIINLLV